MKNRTLQIILCLILLSAITKAQSYFITMKGDSVPCKTIIDFVSASNGKIVEFIYQDKNGKEIKQKKKEIPEMKTICMAGKIYDRMPLKMKKPDSYYRFGWRVVNGKIRVSVYDNQTTTTGLQKNFDGTTNGRMTTTTSGTYLRHVRMPDGTIHEVQGFKGTKALKKVRAYMFECNVFEKEYNSNPKYKSCTFEETVEDYNKMCPGK